jgi:predicted nucleic acid-binding protein
MTRFVIDGPTLLHLVAEGVGVAPQHQLVAPQLLRSQALGLLFDAVGRGELTEREALDRHDAMTAIKVRLLGDRVSRRVAWQIARDRRLSTAEAEYLAVTRLQADVFVSVDPAAGRGQRASSRSVRSISCPISRRVRPPSRVR